MLGARCLRALAIFGLVLGWPGSTPAASAASAARPNVVLILADDLGYGSLGCYGGGAARTPHLDQLAAGGMRFTDFHSNGPMCSPTRAALLTGRYPQRCAWVADEELSPVFRAQRDANPVQRWAWGISPAEVTLPAVLRSAGYRTALIGKWHLGYDFKFHPMNYGFDEFRGFMGGNVDYHTHVAGYGLQQVDWWRGKEIANEAGYTTDLLTRHAVEFITRHRPGPFFLLLAHAAPHDPWQGRDPTGPKAPEEIYREMIEGLDASVGAVVAALRAHNLEQDTLLVFCSDNGPAAPRGVSAAGRLRGRKGSMLEGGHRVPCIASWPGVIAAGTTSAATGMTMDFFPTFVRLVGASMPAGHELDGRDLGPILREQAPQPERTLHWGFGEAWAVRQGTWKLVGEGRRAAGLYQLEQDLGERDNLIGSRTELADRLAELHRRWATSVGTR